MATPSEAIDLSKPVVKDEDDLNAKKKDEAAPLAKMSQVFSKFGRTRKVAILRFVGILFSIISGCVYPIMAFFFARSFEDLGGGGDDYMAQIRNLAYTFMVLGAVGFFFLVGQAVCLEIAASDAQTDLKIQWFNALLRQDMAYFDIKDVSAQATVVSANANKFKR
jgi:ATP-binding cassette subfamily B (MDR/TAP) protein 1